MAFDEWYNKQDRLIKIILLVIPFVGWVVEVLIRISAFLKKQTVLNLAGLILFGVFGSVITYADLVWILLTNHHVLME